MMRRDRTTPAIPAVLAMVRAGLGLGLAICLGLAACGQPEAGTDTGIATADGGGGRVVAPGAPSSTVDRKQAQLNYARCLRDQGIPARDPDGTGKAGIPWEDPSGTPGAKNEAGTPYQRKLDAALRACRKHVEPDGPEDRLSPEELEQARRFAACMRRHGVKDYPDPPADGNLGNVAPPAGRGSEPPEDPAREAANLTCRMEAAQEWEAGAGSG